MSLAPIIETILFAYGEPMTQKKLAQIAGVDEMEVQTALKELAASLEERGIILLEKDNAWQLGTQPKHAPYLKTLVKEEFGEELSKAAMETLAVIAYRGPLTRADVEYIRGVNSSFMIRSLLMRGLVERAENPKDARAWCYRVSLDFLKHFGVARMEDLPKYQEYRAAAIEILAPASSHESQHE